MPAKSKLTQAAVDRAQPQAREVTLACDQVAGFMLRIRPTGAKTFRVAKKVAGTLHRVTIGTADAWTVGRARERAREIIRALEAGEDPSAAKRAPASERTVAELVALYLTEGRRTKADKTDASWATDASNLRSHVIPILGGRSLSKVTRQDIEALRDAIVDGRTARTGKRQGRGQVKISGGAGTANRTLAVAGAMWAWAVAEGYATINPVQHVRRLKTERRERFLSVDELHRLGAALDRLQATGRVNVTHADCLRVLILSGARRSDIADLRWQWVDFERGGLALPNSKSGFSYRALNDPAMAILHARAEANPDRRPEDWVFPGARGAASCKGGLKKAWEAVRGGAGLEGVRLHDLRHTYASQALAAGADLFTVSKLLGHKTLAATQIYAHLAVDPLKKAANATAARMEGKTDGV